MSALNVVVQRDRVGVLDDNRRTRYQRELQVAFPIRTRGHDILHYKRATPRGEVTIPMHRGRAAFRYDVPNLFGSENDRLLGTDGSRNALRNL